MEDAKSWMLIASIMGAAAGIYFTSVLNPLNNYVVFMAIFALIGICIANLVLLALISVDRWQKGQGRSDEETQEAAEA